VTSTTAPASGLDRPGDAARPSRLWWLALGVALACFAVGAACAYGGLVPPFVARAGLDKVLHFAMGGTLAGLLDGALGRRSFAPARGLPKAALPLAAVLVLVPVGVEEYLQRFSACRSSSFGDFAADALGVAAGIWASRAASSLAS
jgi:hypothetical protein